MTPEETKKMREWFVLQFTRGFSDKDIDDMISTMEKELPGVNIRLEMVAVIRDLMENLMNYYIGEVLVQQGQLQEQGTFSLLIKKKETRS